MYVGPLVNKAIEYQRLYEALVFDAEDGEVPPDAGKLLNSMEGGLQRHFEGVATVYRQLLVNAEVCQKEADKLQARANKFKADAEWMKGQLKLAMETLGVKKLKSPLAHMWIQTNGGKPGLEIDEAQVPDEYKYEYKEMRIDKEKIIGELEDGEALPFARRKPVGEHIRIK